MKKTKNRSQRKHNRALAKESYQEPEGPHSFIIHQGKVGSGVKNLISDFKSIMKPFTAEKLIAKKRNSLKDFISMAGPFKVTHLMIFSQTDSNVNLKLSRLPQGPTLYFRIIDYCLKKDVVSSQTNPMSESKHSLYAPCFMTNLQHSEGEQHLQLCSQMFLNMFPTINPTSIKTNTIKRCCLIHYDEQKKLFDVRHYAIKFRPAGVSKATVKILRGKVPNLSSFTETSDFIEKSDVLSGSEAEDDPSTQVIINKKRKGEVARQQSVVKLHELGPRLTLKLIKIEDDVCDGDVLYHALSQLTDEEKLKIKEKKAQALSLKRSRQRQQEMNIELKKKKKEEHRQRCLQGPIDTSASSSKRKKYLDQDDDDLNDDIQHFREEVGEDPDEDLFKKTPRIEQPPHHNFQRSKKKKKAY